MSRWWRIKHAVKYWDYRPKWIVQRFKERRLAGKRGYSTFVLDEFDSHFNEMAVASLRYHLSSECVVDNEAQRPVYEDLIARLSEPDPPATPAAFKSWQAREDEWVARINRARHDFVDIMPGLWS